jgi:outer membrane receptor protein involved in Fe transport
MIFSRCQRNVLMVLVGCMLAWNGVLYAKTEEVSFDIGEGKASETLKIAARQGDVEILISVGASSEAQTNSIKGILKVQDALDRMLEGTPLEAVPVSGGEAFGIMNRAKKGGHDLKRSEQQQTLEPVIPTQMNLKENNKKRTIGGLFKGLVALAVATAPNLSAQDEVDDEVYELSPFQVDASQDTGYTATSTLAGTRVRTNLKDLGAAISVYTTEFLEDTGATDAATLLSYTSNAEVGGNQGNFSGAEAVENGRYFQRDERTNPQQNQRIRGLGRADLTRNLFLTDIPFDSYNTDRVTVSRGPNSLLFGIGSPGGVIENSTKQAIQGKDFGEAQVRIDNYGSLRASFDYNKSLVEDRIALRIALLNEEAKYKQDPTFDDQTRFYGAMDFILSKNEGNEAIDATRLRLNYETGEQKSSPVEIIPPSTAYHGWFEPTSANIAQFSGIAPPGRVVSPSEGGTWQFQETFNPFAINSEGGINTNTHPSWFRWIAAVWDDPNNSVANLGTGDGLQGYQGLLTWSAGRGDTLDRTGLAGTPGAIAAFGPDAPGDTSVNRTVDYHANSPYSEAFAIGFSVPTIQNTDVFDYRNQIYSGGVDRVDREFDDINIAFEQGFFDNKLSIEIAYDEQHYETHQDFLFTGSGGTSTTGPYDLYVSIAEYLQNGEPNPNLGRAYTRIGRPETRFSEIDRETFRTTIFGELDFSEKDGFSKWLGRHRFTGLYNDQSSDTHTRNSRESWVSNDFDVRAAVQGPNLNSARSTAGMVFFSSDSLLGVQSIDDVRINQLNVARPQPGDSFLVNYTDTSSANTSIAERTLRNGSVQLERWLNDENVSQSNIEAKAFALQSYLFSDNIVGLYGFREDDTTSFARATEAETGLDDRGALGVWNPDFTRLSTTPSLEETGDTTTWSIVGRYPENVLGELPAGMDIQAHYAESENFNPVGLRNNALGQSIGQPGGTTEEYGFQVGFSENKYIIKANWFTTALNDVDAGPRVNIGSEAYGAMTRYRQAEIDGIDFSEQLVTVNGDPGSFPIQDYTTFIDTMLNNVPAEFRSLTNPRMVDNEFDDGLWDTIEWDNIPALRSTQDRIAEGFEVEFIASPVKGWRILGSISQQETIQSNTASVMAAVVEEFNGNLQASRAGEVNRSPDLTVQTRPINEIWLVNGLAPIRSAKALDNTVSNEQREWRYTFVTSYKFMEGKFKDFSIGGAGRWQSEAATGYVFGIEPETGVPVPDVSRPYYDDGLFSGDLWATYERELNDNLHWRIQLNIRNAFGDNDDVPVKTNPDGQVAVIRTPNPRTIYLTNAFSF